MFCEHCGSGPVCCVCGRGLGLIARPPAPATVVATEPTDEFNAIPVAWLLPVGEHASN